MKQILYVSYDGMTDPLGQSQVLPYLCGLAERGYSFTLISCEKPQRFKANKHIIEKITSENNIDWYPLKYTKKPPVLSTMKDLRLMKKTATDLQKKKSFSLVHCRGHIPALIGLHLKRKFGVKFLFDMRGFWADEKVDAGAWNLNNPLYRMIYKFFKQREKDFIEESDHIVGLTFKGIDEMLSWEHVKKRRECVTVIPCCVDAGLFDPASLDQGDKENLQQGLGIDKKDVVISYLGSIGTWYMLDEMLDFFIRFKNIEPAAKFFFITQDEHERIRNTAKTKGINNEDIIIRPAKRAEVPLVLSLSNYSLFFIRPSYSKISSSPTKQGEIMAMGIPVICNSGVGDTDMIVQKYHSGVLVSAITNKEYADSIKQLVRTSFNPAEIRNGALDFFSLEKGLEKYSHIYRHILS